MKKKPEHPLELPQSLVVEDGEPFEIINQKAFRIYTEYGRLGTGVISEAAETSIEIELDALTAYTASLARTSTDLLKATTDPAKMEESRQRALIFYRLVVDSLRQQSS